MKKILIFGDDTRSFLTCVRSFGRGGFEVHTSGFGPSTAALASRYIAKTHSLPAFVDEGTDWLDSLLDLIEHERFAALLPCDERAMLPLDRFRNRFPTDIWLGLPNPIALKVFFDKFETRQLAQSLGVPVAKGYVVLASEFDPMSLTATLPVAIKPIQSFSIDTLYKRNEVQLVKTQEQLSQLKQPLTTDKLLIESLFPGEGKGLSVLCKSGLVIFAFQHRRCHSEANGGSAYRVSEPTNAGMLEAVASMCAKTEFSGVAMFEFKVDTPTNWVLLEVNARPWGSLPLAVNAGIDFPLSWYKSSKESISKTTEYRTPYYGRNFMQDLYFIKAQIRAEKSKLKKLQSLAAWLSEFIRIVLGREAIDEFALDDPGPALRQLSLYVESKRGRPSRAAVVDTQRRLAEIVQAHGLYGPPEKPFIVEFVCHGNICRSPYAAAKFKKLIEGNVHQQFVVKSAGLLPVADRKSPEQAQAVALAKSLDLAQHRSSFLSPYRAKQASLILLFDSKNESIFRARDSQNQAKTINIAHLLNLKQIEDPYGKDQAEFMRTYELIDRLCTELLKRLEPITNQLTTE